VAYLPGSADEIRGRVPEALAAYEFARDHVLRGGLVDPTLKELCFRYLAEDPEVADFSRFDGRKRAALEWAQAIAWDSEAADDALWERLHALFSEPELVELGCSIGFELGQQHWRRTVGLPPRDDEAHARAS
jgi:alkylhydroperoxidase family enzyme